MSPKKTFEKTSRVDSGIMAAARSMCPPGSYIVELAPRAVPRWFAKRDRRWFIPMDGWRVRLSGSGVYPALSTRARAYRVPLRIWITVGGALYTHHTWRKDEDAWPLRDQLLADLPTLATAAVSIGVHGPGGRKIAVQLMDKNGGVIGFGKYGDNQYTRGLIANEAEMLASIPDGTGPRMVRHMPFLNGDLLVQTPLPGRARVQLRIDEPQKRFYERLIRPQETYPASAHPLITRLRERSSRYRDVIEEVATRMGHAEWPVAWMHGDMGPFNMRWSRVGCLAFDWEHATKSGFPYLDAAAMLIQVCKIKRLDPRKAQRAVLRELGSSLPDEYARIAAPIASLAALHMLVSWYPPRQPDYNERWLQAFVEEALRASNYI